jgi:hypothetical protein
MTDLASSVPGPSPPPRRRWRRLWRYAALSLLTIIGVPLGWYFYQRHAADRELQEAIAEVDRTHPGWRLQELLDARPPIAAEKNSANVVIAAQKLLPKDWPFKALDEIAGVPPPVRLRPDQEAAVREELKALAPALVEARKLADYSRGRYTITYAPDWLSTLVPDLQNVREIGSLLRLDVRLSLQDGEQGRAWRSCHALLNAGRSIGDEPSLIGPLIRIAIDSSTVHDVERSLGQGEVDAPALGAMQKVLEEECAEDLVVIGLRGERAGTDHMLTNIETGRISLLATLENPGRPGTKSAPGFWDGLNEFLAVPMVKRSHAWLLRYHTKVIEACQLPGMERYHAFGNLEDEVREQNIRQDKSLIMAALLFPAILKVPGQERRGDTLLHCAVAGLAAERFRVKHKRWPESLDELVKAGLLKEVPIDLFDGQPVRLRRTKDGIVVHSVARWIGSTVESLDYQGDALDNLQDFDEKQVRIEFRLWDPDHRRQPPLPPRLKRDGQDDR